MTEPKKTILGPFRDDPGGPAIVDEPEPTHDEMMEEMRPKVEYETFPSPSHWQAGLMWMERDGARIYLIARGKEPTEAVRNLYQHFQRMNREGWERTK